MVSTADDDLQLRSGGFSLRGSELVVSISQGLKDIAVLHVVLWACNKGGHFRKPRVGALTLLLAAAGYSVLVLLPQKRM